MACLCKARYELLTTSLVSARGRAPAQPACPGPAGPVWFPLGPSRKSQHDSKLPGPEEQGPPPRSPPRHLAPPNFPALLRQNVPMNTRTYCSAQSLRMVTHSLLGAALGLLVGGGQVKQCVDEVQNRVVMRGTCRRRNARPILQGRWDSNRQKKKVKCNYFSLSCHCSFGFQPCG